MQLKDAELHSPPFTADDGTKLQARSPNDSEVVAKMDTLKRFRDAVRCWAAASASALPCRCAQHHGSPARLLLLRAPAGLRLSHAAHRTSPPLPCICLAYALAAGHLGPAQWCIYTLFSALHDQESDEDIQAVATAQRKAKNLRRQSAAAAGAATPVAPAAPTLPAAQLTKVQKANKKVKVAGLHKPQKKNAGK